MNFSVLGKLECKYPKGNGHPGKEISQLTDFPGEFTKFGKASWKFRYKIEGELSRKNLRPSRILYWTDPEIRIVI